MLINHTHEPRMYLLSRYDMSSDTIEITLGEKLTSGEFFHTLRCNYKPEKLIDDIVAPFASFIDNHDRLGGVIGLDFVDDNTHVQRRIQMSRQDAQEFVDCLDRLLISAQDWTVADTSHD